MQELDVHLGGRRPFGLNYWPLAQAEQKVQILLERDGELEEAPFDADDQA